MHKARVLIFIIELWDVLRRPSPVFGLGVLVLAGFVAGVMFWDGFNTALELTNTEKFCTGCHEMRDNVFAELPMRAPCRWARARRGRDGSIRPGPQYGATAEVGANR